MLMTKMEELVVRPSCIWFIYLSPNAWKKIKTENLFIPSESLEQSDILEQISSKQAKTDLILFI